jgi:sugar phosphate isomerase/epimerase
MNMMKRRSFIRNTGGSILGMALCGKLMGRELEEAKRIKKFGIQLYTVRDELAKDPRKVLKQLASFGYKQIESYERDKGMFWGLGHTGFRSYMDELGMSIISSHCDVENDFRRKIDEAAAIGMKYLICADLGDHKNIDPFKRSAERFNEYGKQCSEAGIRFAYHNHDYTFRYLEGQLPQDILMKYTDPMLVDFELDIFWAVYAGQDPVAWLKKYPGRFTLCHVKDRSKIAEQTREKNTVDLGTGSIDFQKILKQADEEGMKYYFAEQEAYPNGSPMEAAKADAAYLKRIKV